MKRGIKLPLFGLWLWCAGCSGDVSSPAGSTPDQTPVPNHQQASPGDQQAAANTAQPATNPYAPAAAPCSGSTSPEEVLSIVADLVCQHAEECGSPAGAGCVRGGQCDGCADCVEWCVCSGSNRNQCQEACNNGDASVAGWEGTNQWAWACRLFTDCAAGRACERDPLASGPLPVCASEVRWCYAAYLDAIVCDAASELEFSQVAACAGIATYLDAQDVESPNGADGSG